jgi:hypothetical protein
MCRKAQRVRALSLLLRPSPNPIRQLRAGLLKQLKNQHLLQQAFEKTAHKEGAAESGKKGGGKATVAGSY